jgi:hypothetical protein
MHYIGSTSTGRSRDANVLKTAAETLDAGPSSNEGRGSPQGKTNVPERSKSVDPARAK